MITIGNNTSVSAPLCPVPSPVQGKNIILYYFILEAEVPDDEYYDEDDHNDVVQYLLDVVDEEAQNLLNRNNATSEAQSLLHIKKATSEDHLPGTESLEKTGHWKLGLLKIWCLVSSGKHDR